MRSAVVFLFLISLSLAATVDISATVTQSGTANMIVKAEIPDGWERPVYLNLSGPLKSVIVKDRSGLELEARTTNEGNRTLVYATVPSDYLEFTMISDSFTTKQGGLWIFDLTFGMSENISAMAASLKLPGAVSLKSTNGAVGGDGSALVISWKARDIDTAHQAHLRAGYELTEQGFDTTLPALAILIIAVIAAYGLFRNRNITRATAKPATIPPSPLPTTPTQPASPLVPLPSSPESNAVFKTLDETDKEIVREIMAQGGKTTQAHLYLHTHVPKATLSRRLASLENRGIIAKSQKGNRNLITLTDIIKK